MSTKSLFKPISPKIDPVIAARLSPVAPKPSQTYLKFSGNSPCPLGSLVLVRRFSFRSAALRPLKVESDINGILPAGGGPLPFISFLA
jgi:hypothetical protein